MAFKTDHAGAKNGGDPIFPSCRKLKLFGHIVACRMTAPQRIKSPTVCFRPTQEPGHSSKPQNWDVPENYRRTGTDLETTPGPATPIPPPPARSPGSMDRVDERPGRHCVLRDIMVHIFM